MYAADAARPFVDDVARIGRGDYLAVTIFTDFGRRIEEIASQGTDQGTDGPMFVSWRKLQGGSCGAPPRLADTANGNLRLTAEFRRVHATMIAEWRGCANTESILKGRFEPLGIFAYAPSEAPRAADRVIRAAFATMSWRGEAAARVPGEAVA